MSLRFPIFQIIMLNDKCFSTSSSEKSELRISIRCTYKNAACRFKFLVRNTQKLTKIGFFFRFFSNNENNEGVFCNIAVVCLNIPRFYAVAKDSGSLTPVAKTSARTLLGHPLPR